MVSCIISRCYSNRIISVTTIIYCYGFTSCIFNSITGNINFVLSIWIASVFTITNSNISNVSIASCSSFFNYTFSRRSTSCWSISNGYFINCFIRISCISSYCYIFRARFYYNFVFQFSFCIIGQIGYHIATRSRCFNVFTTICANYAEAQTTSLV